MSNIKELIKQIANSQDDILHIKDVEFLRNIAIRQNNIISEIARRFEEREKKNENN